MAVNRAYFDPDDAVPRLPLPYSIVDDVVSHVLTKAWQAVRARAMTPSVTSFRASVRVYDGPPAVAVTDAPKTVSACLARRQAPYTHVHAYEDGHDDGGNFLVRVDDAGVVTLSPHGADEDVVTIHAFTCTEPDAPAPASSPYHYDRLDVGDVSFIDSTDTWRDALLCARASSSLPSHTCAPAPDHALAATPVVAPAPAAPPEPAPKPRSRDGTRGTAAAPAPAPKPGSGHGTRPRAVGFAASETPSQAAPLVALRVWSGDERDRGFLLAVAATAVATHVPLPTQAHNDGDARPPTADASSGHKNRRASSGVQPDADVLSSHAGPAALPPTGVVRLFHIPAHALSLGATVDVTDEGVCVWRTRALSSPPGDDAPAPAPVRLLAQMCMPCGVLVTALQLSMDGRFMAVSGSDATSRVFHLDPRVVTPPPMPPVVAVRASSTHDVSDDDEEGEDEEVSHRDARERPASRSAVTIKLKLPTQLRPLVTLSCPWVQALFEAPPVEVAEPEPAPAPAAKPRAGSARKGGHAAPVDATPSTVVAAATSAAPPPPQQRVHVPLEMGVYFTCVRLHSPGGVTSEDAAPPPRDSDAASSVHTASHGQGHSRASARSGHTHASRATRARGAAPAAAAAAAAAASLPLNACGSDGVPVCVGIAAWWRYVGSDAGIHARAPATLYRWTFHTHEWTHAVMLPHIESRVGGPEDPRPLPAMLCDDVAVSNLHAPPCTGDVYPSLSSHTIACGEPRIVLGHADGSVVAYAPLRIHAHAPRRTGSRTQAVTCVAVLGRHSAPHSVVSMHAVPLHSVARVAIDARCEHAASVSTSGQLQLYTMGTESDASEAALRVYDGDAGEVASSAPRLFGLISGPGVDSPSPRTGHTFAVRWDTYTHVHTLGFTPGVDARGAPYHPFLMLHACEGVCDAAGCITVHAHTSAHSREAVYVYDVRAAHLLGSVNLRPAPPTASSTAAAAMAVWDAATAPPTVRSGSGIHVIHAVSRATDVCITPDADAPRCSIIAHTDAWMTPLTTIAVNAYPVLSRAMTRMREDGLDVSSSASVLQGFLQACDGAARVQTLALSTTDLMSAAHKLAGALQAQALSALRGGDARGAAAPTNPRGRRPSETGASVMTHTHAGAESVAPPAASPHTTSPSRGFMQAVALPHDGEGDIWARGTGAYVGTERFQLPHNARESVAYYATVVPQAREARLQRLQAKLEARLQPVVQV